jgi:hypothetical protein
VDLGKSDFIASIETSSRIDDCSECVQQGSEFYVLVSDQPFTSTSLTATLADTSVSAWYQGSFFPVQFVPINRTGRYVRIQRPNGAYALSLAEVQVWSGQTYLKPMALPRTPSTGADSQNASATFDVATSGRLRSAEGSIPPSPPNREHR